MADMGSPTQEWVAVPWEDVTTAGLGYVDFVMANLRKTQAYKHLLQRASRLVEGDVEQPVVQFRDSRKNKRGPRPGSGQYPDRASLMRVLLPIYRWMKVDNHGKMPSMQQVCDCKKAVDTNGKPIQLLISRARLRTLRGSRTKGTPTGEPYIPWPPE